ncbi:M48 family metalloprotease [Microcoleus sp. FACHB-672]|uniref:M48 family metalloprotease n=1 Tax=Microcoleus sp. FACHB-672 TaxID=2692825 RepID=UPI002B278E67|nr:M48 family metalloprotease [Microcoleus sp. FACHB-672]
MMLTVMLAPVAAIVVQLAISRTREFAADAGSAKLTGNPAFDPLLIMNAFSGQFLGDLFSTHPSTEARIEHLLKLEQQQPKFSS